MKHALFNRLLVLVQFVLIGLLFFPFPSELRWSWQGLLALAAGALLGICTLLFNRIGNFNIRPEPKPDGKLVTTGPYRYLRHPMYTAVLLVCAAPVLSGATAYKTACWLLLLALLWKKSSIEEVLLRQQFADYAAYAATAGRFLPRCFRPHAK